MQSIRSRLIIGLIRNRHLFQFKLKPEIIDHTFSVEKFRSDIDKASANSHKVHDDIALEPTQIQDMYAEWIIPKGAPLDKVMLYIHGGGFISGSCLTHRGHVAKFALGSGIKMLLFDYRLAPEHPFPAALDDCITAYEWLLSAGYQASNILIGGESAGATLTLSTLIALRDSNKPSPCAGLSISPVTDLTCQAESFKTNAKNDIAPMNSWTIWTEYYIGTNDPHNPLLSPLNANLDGLPPLMLVVGTYEIHLDDVLNFSHKAKAAGNETSLMVYDHMVHAFPILSPLFPEAIKAMDDICGFIRWQLGINDKEKLSV